MIDEFVYKANPNEWLEVSDELNHSLETLVENNGLVFFKGDTWNGIPIKKVMNSRAIFLLMGFAIENLIKGIIVFDKPENVNTGILGKEIKTHNLCKLLEKIPELRFTDQELQFVETITEAIPDWGRYPSPIKFQDIKDEVLYIDEIMVSYKSVRIKLRDDLIFKLQRGWISGLDNEQANVKIIEIFEKKRP
ncbi:hypothetical protein [Flavobacterium sp.]|uniref:hypothetical protein n=1 Tax=Flavobacterium sp. TaxID=239 RepID=UPI0031CF3804